MSSKFKKAIQTQTQSQTNIHKFYEDVILSIVPLYKKKIKKIEEEEEERGIYKIRTYKYRPPFRLRPEQRFFCKENTIKTYKRLRTKGSVPVNAGLS